MGGQCKQTIDKRKTNIPTQKCSMQILFNVASEAGCSGFSPSPTDQRQALVGVDTR